MNDENDDCRDFVHRPHDALFQRVMSDTLAVRELVEMLPDHLRERVDLDSVRPTNSHFVSDQLRHLYSDCLLEARLKTGERVRLYFLVEHQSQADQNMPFRFVEYTVSVWAQALRENDGKGKLPLVIPVLVYNGKGDYPYSLELKDLIDAPADLIARYLFSAPTLIALGDIPDAQLAQKAHLGAALMAMKHAYDEIPADLIFQLVATFEDPKRRLGFAVSLFSYIITIGRNVDQDILVELVSKHLGEEAKEGAMTIAEQLIEKGRDEGIALVARRMLANGFDLETVRKQVDLPLEDLMLLRDGRKKS